MQSAAQHNGKQAVITDFDKGKGRYTLQLKDGENLSVKPANMQQMVDNVKVVDMQSKPELNGQTGLLIDFNDEKGRYHVQLKDGKTLSLQPHNLVVPSKTRGEVQGLSKDEYNGKVGKVTGFAEEAKRYLLELPGAQVLKIKPENLKI